MDNLKMKINELNDLVLQGRTMEAFEKFYAENVSMQENELPATTGKNENRIREEAFLNSLIDFRGAEVIAVTYGENVTMVKWRYDYTHKDWGVKNYTQVSVQHWENGFIVKEQFFYGN